MSLMTSANVRHITILLTINSFYINNFGCLLSVTKLIIVCFRDEDKYPVSCHICDKRFATEKQCRNHRVSGRCPTVLCSKCQLQISVKTLEAHISICNVIEIVDVTVQVTDKQVNSENHVIVSEM
jgi:hypothetical protein